MTQYGMQETSMKLKRTEFTKANNHRESGAGEDIWTQEG
jgi:hypothetical protein